jgi:hypothetical protein
MTLDQLEVNLRTWLVSEPLVGVPPTREMAGV